jgi:hypothetical protein
MINRGNGPPKKATQRTQGRRKTDATRNAWNMPYAALAMGALLFFVTPAKAYEGQIDGDFNVRISG